MARRRKHSRARPAGSGPRTQPRERTRATRGNAAIYWALAVGLCAVAVYLNALGSDFVLDDVRLIRDNVRIRSLANVPHLFASSYWGTQGAQALYRPLVLATYAVNYAMHGLSTYWYTAFNIALHAAVSMLLFALVRAIGGSLVAAAVVGIAFAVHPVHTEAVAAMSGRPELLAALFFILAMICHRQAPGASRAAIRYRLGTLACFACALLSKESAMTLVLVLPVMDALLPARGRDGTPATPRARILSDYLPLLGVAVAYLALRRAVLGGIVIAESAIAPLDNPLVPLSTMPLGDRMGATAGQAIATAFAVVVEYARLLVWPARLSPDYSYNQIPLVTSVLDGRSIAGVALVAACVCGIVALRRRSPIAAFGLAFTALTFSIVSNFVITIGTICAERLMYLPSAGVLVAAAIGVERLAESVPARRWIVYAALAIAIVVGAARTGTRNLDWRNESALWSAAIVVTPGSARVQTEYGRILMASAQDEAEGGRAADAERLYAAARTHFEAALTIYPSYSLPIDGLAMIESLHDRFDEADPLYARAMKAWPGNYASLTNWGSLLWERSRHIGAAASELRKQGKITEADELVAQADAGFRQALDKNERAIAMMPSYAPAHLNRAMILETYVGDPSGAIVEFEQVLSLMPNHPQRRLIESELQRLRSAPRSSSSTPAPVIRR
jgi:tetratricopeptide (TPR) repeat protein